MKRLCVLFALLCCCAVQAQTEGIWFLHFRMTSNHVVLVSQKKTPGTLKRSRVAEAPRALELELESANGAKLWTQSLDDPAVRRLEYEDPAEPGRLRVREVTLTNVEFTVRVPFQPNARMAVLSRHTRTAPKNLAAAEAVRTEIGRVALKPEENP